MPNTLAHLGFQGAASRAAGRDVPVHWVVAGVVIPDLPWILYRVIRMIGLSADPYDLRLYAIVQSSLAFSLALGIALVLLLARRRLLAGAVVVGNLLLHLLLDGLQRKWGNGVTLLAPADWSQWSLNLFWPEGAVSVIGTAVGVLYCVYMLSAVRQREAVPIRRGHRALLSALGLLVIYAAGPLWLTDDAERANNHYIATLRDRPARVGRAVQFDRVSYHPTDPPSITTFAGERIYLRNLDGRPDDRTATASVRGEFSAVDAVEVEDVHYHWPWFREVASVVGLLAGLVVWLVVLIRGPGGRPPGAERAQRGARTGI